MDGYGIASADGRIRATHPRSAALNIAGILLLAAIVLTAERIAHRETTTAATHFGAPFSAAARQGAQVMARLLYEAGETPRFTGTTSLPPICSSEFIAPDGVAGRFVVDRETGRLTQFSCRPSLCTTRLLKEQGVVHSGKDAEARARTFLARFFPQEVRRPVATLAATQDTVANWHIILEGRSDTYLVTLDGPTGALLLLNRHPQHTDPRWSARLDQPQRQGTGNMLSVPRSPPLSAR